MDGKKFHQHETSTAEILKILLHEMLIASLQVLGFPRKLYILYTLQFQTTTLKQHGKMRKIPVFFRIHIK
jgi:hypothetical protein